MKIFLSITNGLILSIFLINLLLVYLFGERFIVGAEWNKYVLLWTLLVFEAVITMVIVKTFYDTPILQLEYTIKKFLSWALKNKDIEMHSTLNPHLNFVLKFFSQTLKTLKNIKSEFIHGKEIKSEVGLAMEIQEKILTKKMISIPSLDIVARSKPAAEIGGDSYDIIQSNDNYYIYVGDATGHGVGAGFIMMMVNALVSGFSKTFTSGASILTSTNEILKPRVKANLLMSLLLVRWNESEKRLFMTWAGHEYLIIYKHALGKCFKIKSGGVALGMIKHIEKLVKEQEIRFEPNDIIVLYSDGITESINTNQKDGNEEMFWEQRIIDAILKAPKTDAHGYKCAQSVFNTITIDLSKFMGYKHKQFDDITLSVIHYKWENYTPESHVSDTIPWEFITEWSWEK